jgi:hypothetical protein
MKMVRMRHLINEEEGPDVYKQGESVCHVTSRDWDSLPFLRGEFSLFHESASVGVFYNKGDEFVTSSAF